VNVVSGIPKFFAIDMIQQEGNPYVRDNTIFITVMIDFVDMPIQDYHHMFNRRRSSKKRRDELSNNFS
jgi:hypothetical protein